MTITELPADLPAEVPAEVPATDELQVPATTPRLDELVEPRFASRHIGLDDDARTRMLGMLGYGSTDELVRAAVPVSILDLALDGLPPAADEPTVASELRTLAGRNELLTPLIGLGYYGTHTPPVIRRNVLENPSWYTAYTPYQPEISQGRLEALINFQTVVSDLTGLATAGSSLLDEATAAAEAMTLARRASKAPAGAAFAVDVDTHPQTWAVLRTRAVPLGIDLVSADLTGGLPDGDLFGVLVSYPGSSGAVRDISTVVAQAHERGALVAVATDLLALTLLTPPGEVGADIALGSAQRFGVPLGYGGPHAGFLAVRSGLERSLPGRLVGVSVDADGAPAYRLALQTREQHIRRDKATSNICTAQVLLAVMAGMYAVWHGPAGLTRIARRTHRLATILAAGFRETGIEVVHAEFFDTLRLRVPGGATSVVAAGVAQGLNLLAVDADTVGVSLDETTTAADLVRVWAAFGVRADVSAQRVPDAPGVPPLPQRDRAAALPQAAGRPRLRPRPRHDPARLLHDEAQRDDRDGADQPARVRRPAPVRAGRPGPRVPAAGRRPVRVAGSHHRLRRGQPPAERRQPG